MVWLERCQNCSTAQERLEIRVKPDGKVGCNLVRKPLLAADPLEEPGLEWDHFSVLTFTKQQLLHFWVPGVLAHQSIT